MKKFSGFIGLFSAVFGRSEPGIEILKRDRVIALRSGPRRDHRE
jgi:hypothetical protein